MLPILPVVDGRFCYLVLCHTHPELVLRLARRIRLLSPDARVVLRHDRGAGFLDPDEVAAAGAEELRSDVHMAWGSWAMVDGTVEALRHVRDEAHVVVVSGQDHPVLDLAAWEDHVRTSGVAALVDAEVAPRWTHRYSYRFRTVDLGLLTRLPRPLRRLLVLLWYARGVQPFVEVFRLPPRLGRGLVAVGVRRRTPFTPDRPAWKGSQWMTLSRAAVDAVLADHPDGPLAHFYRSTFVPDEGYLPTLLHRSGLAVTTAPTSYVVFDDPDAAHPRGVDDAHVRAARAAGAPFVRKVLPGDPAGETAVTLADALTRPGGGR